MIVQRFLKWKDSANVARREAAASALARAYLTSEMDFEERCAAEAAVTALLDDPSPKVRMALAEVLAASHQAPLQVVTALADDQPEIAALTIGRSPLLADADLITRLGIASPKVQAAIASRPIISSALGNAIAARGCADACLALLANEGALIRPQTLWTIIERFGDDADMRGMLLSRDDLCPSMRLALMGPVAKALADSPFIAAALGAERAASIVADASARAMVHFTNTSAIDDADDLIGRLRASGNLTTHLLIRAACLGKIDFLAHALTELSGQKHARVRSILIDGRDMGLRALFAKAGLSVSVHPLFATAIRLWRDVANGRLDAGAQEITRMIMQAVKAVEPTAANDNLVALLRSIYLEAVRENARAHARMLSNEPDFIEEFEMELSAQLQDEFEQEVRAA